MSNKLTFLIIPGIILVGVTWVATAQKSNPGLSGTGGTATQRAVVNFDDIAKQSKTSPATSQTKPVPPFIPLPQNLPVPRNLNLSPEDSPPPTPSQSSRQSSPTPKASFLALEDNNTSIPPDTHGAVGPNHLMVTLNTQVRIQKRSGQTISTVALDDFWASVSSGSNFFAFDPKVLYDPYGKRWIFTACANGASPKSSVLIGVSRGNDPTKGWNLYRIDADSNNRFWADYPSLGFNKDWIVVQVNMFPLSGGGFRSNIYTFNKQNLYSGGSGKFTLFKVNTIGGVQAPAITYSKISTLYLLQDWNGNSGGQGFLRLYSITGAVGKEKLNGVNNPTFISTSKTWAFGPPKFADFAPQQGSSRKIQANDSRMQNLVYRNDSLWAAHTVFLPATGGATRSTVQWWQINPKTAAIQQLGRIGGSAFFAFPTIAVNKNNDVLIGYSQFSPGIFASASYSFRRSNDPPNTLRQNRVLKRGQSFYYKTFGGGENRWGDYSNTVVDPTNDRDLWTIQEYAAKRVGSGNNDSRWGTWWGKIVP